MAKTWTDITNGQVSASAALTTALVTALRDNPEGIAGAATGAPYVQAAWHPYDGETIGDGNDGLIYDQAVDGNVGVVETPHFEDGYEYRLICLGVSGSSTGAWAVDLYLETDTTWAQAASDSTNITSGVDMGGVINIYEPRRSALSHCTDGGLSTHTSGDTSSAQGAVIDSTAQKIRNARIDPPGLMNDGKIYMQRRKVEDGT